MAKRSKSSYLWAYFTDRDHDTKSAKCDICGQILSYKTTVSNLRKHISSKHPTVDLKSRKSSENHTPSLLDSATSISEDNAEVNVEAHFFKGKSSYLWAYFTDRDHDTKSATCDICGQILSYKTTVSNLRKHISSKHPTVDLKSRKSSENPLQLDSASLISEDNATPPPNVSEIVPPLKPTTSPMPDHVQTSMHFVHSKKLPENKKKYLDNLLLKLFTVDFQPFSIVEDKGFQAFVHALNPSYCLPSKKTISKSLIPAEYEKCLNSVRALLRSVESVCITTDTWTSRNAESFVAVTAHFIDNFTLRSALLSCEKLPGSHRREHLAEAIKSSTEKFGLSNKVLVCVTDDTSNVNPVEEHLPWEHFPCFAHTTNLIVGEGLAIVTELLTKIKTTVTFFKKSTTACVEFHLTQGNLGIEQPKKLIQSVDTLWNSTYYMVERFYELKDALKMTLAVLNDKNIPTLTCEEWEHCRQLCDVLRPFEEVTRQMSEEKYVKGSEVIVLVKGLDRILVKLKSQIKSGIMRTVIDTLHDSLNRRLQNVEFSKSIGLATILDPRCKLLPFTDKSVADHIKQHLNSLLDEIIAEETKPAECLGPIACDEPPRKKFSIWDEFDDMVTKVTPIGTAKSAASAELDRYLQVPYLPRQEDPLRWWEQNQHVFPNIVKVAVKKFNVLATSVPCERIFSKTGSILNERRSRLSSQHTEQIMFINQNSNIIK